MAHNWSGIKEETQFFIKTKELQFCAVSSLKKPMKCPNDPCSISKITNHLPFHPRRFFFFFFLLHLLSDLIIKIVKNSHQSPTRISLVFLQSESTKPKKKKRQRRDWEKEKMRVTKDQVESSLTSKLKPSHLVTPLTSVLSSLIFVLLFHSRLYAYFLIKVGKFHKNK